MNFGEVLSRAWNITWKYKTLWVFGLLATLGGGSGGGNGIQNSFQRNGNNPIPGLIYPNGGFENTPAWVPVLIVLAILVMVVVFVLLGALGKAGLTRGAWLADSGAERLSFSQLFAESRTYFVRVLLLGIVSFIISVGLLLLTILPTTLAAVLTGGVGAVCFFPLMCIVVPVFLALSLIFDLGVIAITGEDLGVEAGLRRGFEVFRSHLAEMIALAVALWIGSAVIGFVISLPILAVTVPFLVGGMLDGGQEVFSSGSLIVGLAIFFLYLPVLLAARAVLTTYVTTTWTLAFRRLTGREAGAPNVIDVNTQTSVI